MKLYKILYLLALVLFSCTIRRLPFDNFTAKEIISFKIGPYNANILSDSIYLALPKTYGSRIIPPIIEYKGASISPASGVIQDFSIPVVYTVTAYDTSTKDYTVIVEELKPSEKQINSFKVVLKEQVQAQAVNPGNPDLGIVVNKDYFASIIGTNIILSLPTDTDINNLSPIIEYKGASISPASGVNQDFSNAITYIVKAFDDTTLSYNASVLLVEPSNASLSEVIIKGVRLNNLPTPSEDIINITFSTISISSISAQDTSNTYGFNTLFSLENSAADIKVVKYTNGSSVNNFETDPIYNNEAISNNDFFIIRVISEDLSILLYYKVLVEVNEISIGDAFLGGKLAYIFQVDEAFYEEGEIHGIIVAEEDATFSLKWQDPYFNIAGTSINLGFGYLNSTIITNSLYNNNQGSSQRAVLYCDDYINEDKGLGVFSDWFLPSKKELIKISDNKDNIGGFSNESYWTSSQSNAERAYAVNFANKQELSHTKNSAYPVRCARYF